MKHKIADDVNVNVNLEFDVEDVTEVVDKVTDSLITLMIVATGAHICKSLFKK